MKLNNLLYIYKTKGTENSIRALLNCYGYPSDFIPIRLYGGTYETLESDLVILTGERQSPRNVTFDAEPVGVTNLIGNKSFEIIKDNHYSYNTTDKKLQLPWWKSEAKGDGIEFIEKLIEDTHYIGMAYNKQGFVILFPVSRDMGDNLLVGSAE